jgi:hypothetical protein
MKKLSGVAFLAVLGMIKAEAALAQALGQPSNPGGLPDFSVYGGQTGIMAVLAFIINTVLMISGTIAVLFLIIGGFQYILSGANEDLAKRGKTSIRNAVIGLIIIILSYTVIRVVFTTLTGRV